MVVFNAPRHEVGTLEVSESGSANLAAIRAVRAIAGREIVKSAGLTSTRKCKVRHLRDKVDTHLSFGSLDRRVGLSRRDRVALGENL